MSFEDHPLKELSAALASSSPTPGGGTAAAAAGALGASLVSMVCALTLSKEKYKDAHEALQPLATEAAEASRRLSRLMDLDSQAFDDMARARKLPKETEEETARRNETLQTSARRAAEVPMETARTAARLLGRTSLLAEKGNPNAASDAGVAALLLAAAAEGALLNVDINLSTIEDAAFVRDMEKETAAISQEVERLRAQTIAAVRKSFKK